MKKCIFFTAIFLFLIVPFFVYPITLVRVGYIDLDLLIQTYTEKYLETEISMRNDYLTQLQIEYNEKYYSMSASERNEYQLKLNDQRNTLSMIRYNQLFWQRSGEIRDDIVFQIIQRNLMDAIKKTSELEGFSLILDNTGNFIYGSEDINLTDKVLFRLEEKLLELQEAEPVVPLSLELEEYFETQPVREAETNDE
jgi:Skp family chaperone for outer membrane proteins